MFKPKGRKSLIVQFLYHKDRENGKEPQAPHSALQLPKQGWRERLTLCAEKPHRPCVYGMLLEEAICVGLLDTRRHINLKRKKG